VPSGLLIHRIDNTTLCYSDNQGRSFRHGGLCDGSTSAQGHAHFSFARGYSGWCSVPGRRARYTATPLLSTAKAPGGSGAATPLWLKVSRPNVDDFSAISDARDGDNSY